MQKMISFKRMCMNRCSQQILNQLKRNISKSSLRPGRECISSELIADRQAETQSVKIGKKPNIRSISMAQPKPQPSFFSEDERQEYMATFPDIVKDLTEDIEYADMSEVNKRLTEMLQYILPKNKRAYGLWTAVAYKMLELPENLTPENIRLAHILSWCIHMLRCFFITMDDLMDNGDLRFGHPCWHKLEGVGSMAPNDALLLKNCIYTLLCKHFGDKKCYRNILDMFHVTTTRMVMGQALDMICKNPDGTPRLEDFTMNRVDTVVKYKSGRVHVYSALALAMYFANRHDPEEHRHVENICMELGNFYQKQNDYLDCFGDQDWIGKEGNDIQEGKCSWLAVAALERATPAQRKIMQEHYGRADKNSVQMVKDLYLELDLPSVFTAFEEQSFNRICSQIEQAKGLPHELFYRMVNTTYRTNF
ncbi:unnamed protein product [Acanthoscelides obtectus]|uniref:Farnesyl diphosphate synthase n=1 Tax=Acanthoscelides obtectus TaxID=200917 RepID=A0A9P0P8M3_ACAOB|nr:unnamed protein product [Acanthoscelides obtectus]CAK1654502.1 Farnesyl pyrophosphate synthase [Acanthoscelides obtectus]